MVFVGVVVFVLFDGGLYYFVFLVSVWVIVMGVFELVSGIWVCGWFVMV